MTRLRTHTFLAALLLGLALDAGPVHAAQPGFAFLQIPAGARASAMAGAYASVARGAEAALWNPAGLDGIQAFELSGSHAELEQKLRHDAVALAGRAWGGGYALTLRALYSEALEARDELGNLTGSFGAHDLEFGLSYGHSIGAGLAIGGSAQLVRERIADLAAQTFAFDIGATLEPAAVPGSRVSVALQNLGPAAHYTLDGTPGDVVGLPAGVHAGLSLGRLVGSGLTLRGALEGTFTLGRPGVGGFGAELANVGGAALRAGWRIHDASSNLTVGAGFNSKAMRFDYAFIPLALDRGESHRFSIARQF